MSGAWVYKSTLGGSDSRSWREDESSVNDCSMYQCRGQISGEFSVLVIEFWGVNIWRSIICKGSSHLVELFLSDHAIAYDLNLALKEHEDTSHCQCS